MNSNKKNAFVGAAIAGLIGMGATMAMASLANADEAKGTCMGANACKGKSACSTGENGCAGQNSCKGKGFLQTTKAECGKLMKKNKSIKWEAPKASDHQH